MFRRPPDRILLYILNSDEHPVLALRVFSANPFRKISYRQLWRIQDSSEETDGRFL